MQLPHVFAVALTCFSQQLWSWSTTLGLPMPVIG
jgi:hypothetical protein